MKSRKIIPLLILILVALIGSSCSVVVGIFKAGMGFGIFIVVVLVIVVVVIFKRMNRK